MEIRLNSIEEAITAIKEGKIIIVVDDADRENEGDFFNRLTICDSGGGEFYGHLRSRIDLRGSYRRTL